MLTEHQIQRFSRQILLREVGGRGQERLLSTPVFIEGQGEAFEVTRRTLFAGGTPPGGPQARLVVGATQADVIIAERTVAAGCRQCLGQLRLFNAPDPLLAVLLGSLAALAAQRLILGLGAPVAVAHWSGQRLITQSPHCPHRALNACQEQVN